MSSHSGPQRLRELKRTGTEQEGNPHAALPALRPAALPGDPSGATEGNREWGCQELVFSADLARGLRTLSRQEEVTLFVALLAAFQTLLYRYSGQDDVVVGA